MEQNSKPDPLGFKLPHIDDGVALSPEAVRALTIRLLIGLNAQMSAANVLLASIRAALDEDIRSDPDGAHARAMAAPREMFDKTVTSWLIEVVFASEAAQGSDERDRRPPATAGPS